MVAEAPIDKMHIYIFIYLVSYIYIHYNHPEVDRVSTIQFYSDFCEDSLK